MASRRKQRLNSFRVVVVSISAPAAFQPRNGLAIASDASGGAALAVPHNRDGPGTDGEEQADHHADQRERRHAADEAREQQPGDDHRAQEGRERQPVR